MTMLEKTLVVVSFIGSLVVNGLAASGALSGRSIGEISDDYPTYVTPDGLTFAIWGVIYTLEFVLVVAQICPSESAEKLLQTPCFLTGLSVRWRLVLAFLLNLIWLPVYVSLLFGTAFVIITFYLGFLVSIYMDLNPKTVSSFPEWVMFAAGISCNASWVLVATIANLFTILGEVGWKDEFGVAGTPGAAVVVVAFVASVAIAKAVMLSDFAWSLVATWALAGLYRMQTNLEPEKFPPEARNKTLAECALWAAIVVGVATLVGLLMIPYNGVFKNTKGEMMVAHRPLTTE